MYFERQYLLQMVRPELLESILGTETKEAEAEKVVNDGEQPSKGEEAAEATADKLGFKSSSTSVPGGAEGPKNGTNLPDKEKLWLLVGVTLCSEEKWVLSRVSDGGVVMETTGVRESFLWFARGPLEVEVTPAPGPGSKLPSGRRVEPIKIPTNVNFDSLPWFLLSTTY